MRTRIFILLFFGLFLNLTGQDLLEEAQEAYQLSRYDEAIDRLDSIVHQDSSVSMEVLTLLARAYQKSGRLTKSKELWRQALQRDTTMIEGALALAQIYRQEQNWAYSVKYYKRLLDLDSNNARYHSMYADQLIQVREIPAALVHSAQAHKLAPQDVNIATQFARLLAGIDSLKMAESILMGAHENYPQNVAVMKELSRTLYKQDKHGEVVEILIKAQEIIDLEDAYTKMLGFSYLEIDSVDRCIRTLSSLLDDMDEEYVHYYLARAFAKRAVDKESKEDGRAAEYHYRRAREAGTSNNIVQYYLQEALLLEKNAKSKEALQLYKRGYAHTDDARLLLNLARLSDSYYADKRIALRYYQKYKKHEKANPILLDDIALRIQYLKAEIHQRGNG